METAKGKNETRANKGAGALGKPEAGHFVITLEMVENAEAYIPLAEKVAYAKTIAPFCIESSETAEQNEAGREILALPEVKTEGIYAKMLLLMHFFLTRYLKVPGVPDESKFTGEVFDSFAKDHPLNQLERLKSNLAVKDKIFNLLADFKELRKIVDTEIYSIRSQENDGMARFMAAVAIMNRPEAVEEMMEGLKEALPVIKDVEKRVRAVPKGKPKPADTKEPAAK